MSKDNKGNKPESSTALDEITANELSETTEEINFESEILDSGDEADINSSSESEEGVNFKTEIPDSRDEVDISVSEPEEKFHELDLLRRRTGRIKGFLNHPNYLKSNNEDIKEEINEIYQKRKKIRQYNILSRQSRDEYFECQDRIKRLLMASTELNSRLLQLEEESEMLSIRLKIQECEKVTTSYQEKSIELRKKIALCEQKITYYNNQLGDNQEERLERLEETFSKNERDLQYYHNPNNDTLQSRIQEIKNRVSSLESENATFPRESLKQQLSEKRNYLKKIINSRPDIAGEEKEHITNLLHLNRNRMNILQQEAEKSEGEALGSLLKNGNFGIDLEEKIPFLRKGLSDLDPYIKKINAITGAIKIFDKNIQELSNLKIRLKQYEELINIKERFITVAGAEKALQEIQSRIKTLEEKTDPKKPVNKNVKKIDLKEQIALLLKTIDPFLNDQSLSDILLMKGGIDEANTIFANIIISYLNSPPQERDFIKNNLREPIIEKYFLLPYQNIDDLFSEIDRIDKIGVHNARLTTGAIRAVKKVLEESLLKIEEIEENDRIRQQIKDNIINLRAQIKHEEKNVEYLEVDPEFLAEYASKDKRKFNQIMEEISSNPNYPINLFTIENSEENNLLKILYDKGNTESIDLFIPVLVAQSALLYKSNAVAVLINYIESANINDPETKKTLLDYANSEKVAKVIEERWNQKPKSSPHSVEVGSDKPSKQSDSSEQKR